MESPRQISAKQIAEAFDVPLWIVGIGTPPLRVRVRVWIRRALARP